MGWIRGRNGSSRGQTLVEFALLSPVIILLLVAILDFGMAMDRRIVLQHAAREGARMAAVTDVSEPAGFDAVCQRACDQAQGAVSGGITFQCEDDPSNPNGSTTDAGDNVKITLPAHWDLPILSTALFGLFKHGIGPINLTATGSARLDSALSGPCPSDKECPPCPD
jgi:hypothetical protein